MPAANEADCKAQVLMEAERTLNDALTADQYVTLQSALNQDKKVLISKDSEDSEQWKSFCKACSLNFGEVIALMVANHAYDALAAFIATRQEYFQEHFKVFKRDGLLFDCLSRPLFSLKRGRYLLYILLEQLGQRLQEDSIKALLETCVISTPVFVLLAGDVNGDADKNRGVLYCLFNNWTTSDLSARRALLQIILQRLKQQPNQNQQIILQCLQRQPNRNQKSVNDEDRRLFHFYLQHVPLLHSENSICYLSSEQCPVSCPSLFYVAADLCSLRGLLRGRNSKLTQEAEFKRELGDLAAIHRVLKKQAGTLLAAKEGIGICGDVGLFQFKFFRDPPDTLLSRVGRLMGWIASGLCYPSEEWRKQGRNQAVQYLCALWKPLHLSQISFPILESRYWETVITAMPYSDQDSSTNGLMMEPAIPGVISHS